MSTYICKCGRTVQKATTADNTGNRQTEGCTGCPYLLPWGPMEYTEGKGFKMAVQGYKCRMSMDIDYTTRFSGSVTDKCTCSIVSLDFEFLERVSVWIAETYPNREIFGPFSRDTIRAVDYSSKGRYRMSISCSQNKAGMAAKAALLAKFFDPDGRRKDLDPKAEKQLILDRIAAGKAAAQEKEPPCAETSPSPTTSPTPAAAPSSTQSPATAPTASTAETVPGGQSRLYLNSQKSAAYRCSPEGTMQFYLFSGRPKWLTSLHLVEQYKKNNPDKLPPAQWLNWWASVNLGWTEITQKEFEEMCRTNCNTHPTPANAAAALPDITSKSGGTSEMNGPAAFASLADQISHPATTPASPAAAPTPAAATTTTAPAAALKETSTTSESRADASRCRASTSGAAAAESSSGRPSPAGAAPATQSPSDAADVCSAADGAAPEVAAAAIVPTSNDAPEIVDAGSEPMLPAFDYSTLPENTAQRLHNLAERALRLTRNYYLDLMEIVVEAHRELCGTVVHDVDNGHFAPKEDTFRAWCSSIGVSKSRAYQLLQIQYIMDNSTPDEQENLAELPYTTMREISKSNTPPEIVQAARQGDITTHKQYQELLKQYQDTLAENQQLRYDRVTALNNAERAEKEREQAIIDRDTARDAQANSARLSNKIANQRDEARRRAAEAEKQRDAAQQTAQDAQARIRELESRPLEVVGASPEDIAKWRAEGAAAAKKELQTELRQAQKEAAEQRRRAEIAEEDSEQSAQEAQDYAAQLGQARQQLEQGEAVRMVRQATDACEALLRPQLYAIEDLGRDDYKAAMALLEELRDKLTWATMNDAWPGDDWPDGYYYDDGSDDPDKWEDEEE